MVSAEGCATCLGGCPLSTRAEHAKACLWALRDEREYPSCALYRARYWHGLDGVRA